MITPAFHFSILEPFVAIFNKEAKILVQILKKKHSDGKVFDVFPYITRAALDIICGTTKFLLIKIKKRYPKTLKKFCSQKRPWGKV